MNSKPPSQSKEGSSEECRRCVNENACHSPRTPNPSATMHAPLLSLSPNRSILMNTLNNQVPGPMQSINGVSNEIEKRDKPFFNGKEHQKPFERNRKRKSNEISSNVETQTITEQNDSDRVSVFNGNKNPVVNKEAKGPKTIQDYFSASSTQSSKSKKISKGKKATVEATVPKNKSTPQNKSTLHFYFQKERVNKSTDSAQLKSPSIQSNQDIGEFEIQESNDTQDSNQDPNQDSDDTASPSKIDEIQIYNLCRLTCPKVLKILEESSNKCLDKLIETGHVTNPISENYENMNLGLFFQDYKNGAVYFNPEIQKIGSSTQYHIRMRHLQEKQVDGVDSIFKILVCDSLTKELCDHVEKSRKETLKAMGCSSKEPESLTELMERPLFYLDLLFHLSEHQDHTYFLKTQETRLLESCLQFKLGLGEQSESMHEWAAADTTALSSNIALSSSIASNLRQLIFDMSGLKMTQLKVMPTKSSWKPGNYIGQQSTDLIYITPSIYDTMHPNLVHEDMYPHHAMPDSSEIKECYNTEHLKKYKSEACENCKRVAKEIMNDEESTLTLVDTNELAWGSTDSHLNFYLGLGYTIIYKDAEAILLYTNKSKSFVYFLGPVCKLLGLHSFKTNANRASAVKRAVSAEVYRQLCKMANGLEDGGKDEIFGNIILAQFMASVLDLQYHADPRYCVALGKDILTPRNVKTQDRKHSALPLRSRNTLSNRTRDLTQGRDGASSGDFERNIFYQMMNIFTWKTTEEAMEKAYNHALETAGNLSKKAIYKRLELFGKGDFLKSHELKKSWIGFCEQKRSNSGNRSAMGWTSEEKQHGDNCINNLITKANALILEEPKGGEFKVWVRTTEAEKKLARNQNGDRNELNWRFDEHLQLPFRELGLRERFKKIENPHSTTITLQTRKYEDGRKKTNPFVTRNNFEYKLLTVVVTQK